ncbi:MAG TPA: hypothetical protein ENH35_00175 [Candidatus Moranbacteria bacterium]|nr:hypothetical protein [Candidatus Moranbacteria bacterium]
MKLRNKNFVAIILVSIFFLLGLFSTAGFNWKNLKYSGQAITTDELPHIASGYYYIKTGKLFLNPEHPPLIKDLAALPLLFINPVLPEISSEIKLYDGYAWRDYPPNEYIFSKNLEIENDQWDWGRVFIYHPQNNSEWIIFWSRFSVILFNSFFLFLIYYFLSRIWGKRTSLITLVLLVFSQFSIAHGSVVAMDFMSSLLQILALINFALLLKKYQKKYFLSSILFFSLALLAKFSSLLILPVAFFGGLIYIIHKKQSVIKYIIRYSLLTISITVVIAIFYYFHTFNMDNSELIQHFKWSLPKHYPQLLAFLSILIENPITKGLAQYINGIIMVFSRIAISQQQIFFMGSFYGSEGAGWLYFPVLYLTKLSLGFIMLNLLGIIFLIIKFGKKFKSKINEVMDSPLILLLVVIILLYLATTLTSDLQIGLRHIMPVIFAISLLTAKLVDNLWNKELFGKIKLKFVFLFLFFAMLVSLIFSFPYYISYYNFLGGGTENGYKIATDSNYDWGGQDVKKLAKWVNDNNIKHIYVQMQGSVALVEYLGDTYEKYNIEFWGLPASGSYIAISISEYQENNLKKDLTANKKYSQLQNNFIKKIGTSILVFQVP